MTHSIADSVALAITTPAGLVVHTGDFKVDYTPINGEVMDFERLAELGKQGVTLLMSDSTNVLRPGYTMSERSVGVEFDRIFMNCNKRIIVATFSSNIHRIQQIINSAVKFKRKVALVGRSMINVMGVAKELGYLTAPEDTIIDIDKIGIYNPEQLVIITTGSQGEPMSALVRMSTGDHKKVGITPEDLVIFSSSPIPGNEKSVGKVIDELDKLGAEIIYNQLADIHVSGHACQEELKLMLALIRPKFFMPVHGEYRFLKQHGQLAVTMGTPKENIFLMENGRILEISKDSARIGGQVPSGIVLIDGLGVGDVGNIVLRDRQLLSENGMIIIVVTLDRKTLKIVSGPDIVTRGFVYVRESEPLMDEIKERAKDELIRCEKNRINEWSTIKSNVREKLTDFIYAKTKRQPMILPIIMEVSTNNSNTAANIDAAIDAALNDEN
ncbi:Ribonuclease J 1 [compost metagenome]